MTDSIQFETSPLMQDVPVIKPKINPPSPTVDLVPEEPKSDLDNKRLYMMGMGIFVIILCAALVIGFLGFRQ